MEYSNVFVVLFGMGTVFTGLICIIILLYIVGYICSLTNKKAEVPDTAQAAETPAANDAVSGKMAAMLTAAVTMHENIDISDIKEIRIRRIGK